MRRRGASVEHGDENHQASRMMRRSLQKLMTDCGGAAVVELAMIAPVLGLMVVGVCDMSNAFSRKLALEQGAHRAIEKIMQTTEDDTVEGTLKTEAVCQVNGTNTDGRARQPRHGQQCYRHLPA